MLNPDFLKTAKKNTKNYPDRDAVICDVIGSDNKVFETTVLKEEVDLALYLKGTVFPKLKDSEKATLLKLIDDFGDMRSFDGSFDATYEG